MRELEKIELQHNCVGPFEVGNNKLTALLLPL